MKTDPIYLDNSATTPLDSEVLETMLPWLGRPANASSVHEYGRKARVAIEAARTTVAKLIGAHPAEIFFVSGGTEANNMALKGSVYSGLVQHIAVGATEHHAVLEPAEWLGEQGTTVGIIPVDADGRIVTDALDIYNQSTSLVSTMLVNNETGVVNDIHAIRERVPNAYLHTDAVQAFGKIPIDVLTDKMDFMTMSAHKIHGPIGVGALYIRKGIDFKAHQHGGAQERNRRAGTEPVALIAGFAKAAQLAVTNMEARSIHMNGLIGRVRENLQRMLPNARYNTPLAGSAPHIMNVSFPELGNTDGEAIIQMLDIKGVAASNGSACVSGSQQPSHVLVAMGRGTEESRAAVRFSVSHINTIDEIDVSCAILADVIRKLRV